MSAQYNTQILYMCVLRSGGKTALGQMSFQRKVAAPLQQEFPPCDVGKQGVSVDFQFSRGFLLKRSVGPISF